MKLPLPRYLQVEPVGQCNLRCQMCPIQFRTDGPPHGPLAFMPFQEFVHLIEQFPELEDLHLQGLGEPMMHPRFFDMVAHAAGRGIHVTTNTNGTLLTDRRAALCVTSGLERIHISLDGARAETFERIRPWAHFDQVAANIQRLVDARRRLHSTAPRMHMVMVLMRRNLEELPELVELAHRWQFEELFVQQLCHDFKESALPPHYRPMRDFVDAESLTTTDPAHCAAIFHRARELAGQLGLRLRLPRITARNYPPDMPGRERCDWPWRGAYVSYQGLAMPCCMISTPDRLNFGNVFARGMEAVWNSDSFQQFRNALDSQQPSEVCRSCSLYHGTF